MKSHWAPIASHLLQHGAMMLSSLDDMEVDSTDGSSELTCISEASSHAPAWTQASSCSSEPLEDFLNPRTSLIGIPPRIHQSRTHENSGLITGYLLIVGGTLWGDGSDNHSFLGRNANNDLW